MSTDAAARILPASDHSLLVRFGTTDGRGNARGNVETEFARGHVQQFLHAVELRPHPAVRNLHPAYASVLVSFDLAQWSLDDAEDFVRGVLETMSQAPALPGRLVLLPVCYDPRVAPDLQEVAGIHGIAVDELVRRHSAPEYTVHFLGFSPGFPYLGGLDAALATARLATPRTSVPAGSVAIGGAQTGIYPMQSPGGWRIVGRTPAALFDARAWPPAALRMGDRIRFEPVSHAAFERLASQPCTIGPGGQLTGGGT